MSDHWSGRVSPIEAADLHGRNHNDMGKGASHWLVFMGQMRVNTSLFTNSGSSKSAQMSCSIVPVLERVTPWIPAMLKNTGDRNR